PRQRYDPCSVAVHWKRGPASLLQLHGHAPIAQDEPCGRVPLDVVRATTVGEADAPTALRHFGVDVTGVDGCESEESVLGVYQGGSTRSPVRSRAWGADGAVVRLDGRYGAEMLADRGVHQRPHAMAAAS